MSQTTRRNPRRRNPRHADRGSRGPGLVQIISGLGCIVVGGFLLGAVNEARVRGNAEEELVEAGQTLFRAMEGYDSMIGHYPSNGDPLEETLDRGTLEPLIREGALDAAEDVTRVLQGRSLAFYGSPDLPTRNHDFWAVLVSARQPEVKALVADTDQYPGYEGERLRGVYVLQGGRWVSRGL